MAFVHLHVHTQYSILDGAARIKSLYSKKDKSKRLITGLIDKAKELEMPAIAITDHGNMFGVMEFFLEAKAKAITPVIGCEVYIAPKTRFDKKIEGSEEKSAMHLILLAKNKEGYDNLSKLVSYGYTEGFYYRPRIDHELIEKYHKGLICLSACMGGEIPIAIRKKDAKNADRLAKYYKSIFGRDFYIELQDHGIPEERPLNTSLYKLAKCNDIGVVVTNDVHYVSREDAKAHDILLAIQTKSTLDNPKRYRFPAETFHLKSEEEMRQSFGKLENAFENTLKIAEECKELDIINKNYFMPDYPIEQGENETSTLRKICMEGLNKYYNNNIPKEALDRLEMEFSVISKMGFEGYFLIVQDFINYARENNIAVGPGRGSAAGSIVAFSTGITKVNPLDYNLLFERFLNPERKSMPDIDVDFQDDKRDLVIEYVKEKYGKDNVAQIATFSSLSGRSVVRDVCRVMGIDLEIADRISKLMPNSGKLLDTYESEDRAEFRKEIEGSHQLKQMFNIAINLDGLVRSVGLHAAGIVVSNKNLTDCVPIYQDSKTGIRASQYEMEHIEKAGLIKIDFLGIKNLRLLQDAIYDIKERYAVNIDLDNIPLNDDKVYEIFRNADTGGIFQFESDGMRKMLINIKPTSFDDLVSSVALYRPGPLNCGMDKQYADRKNKRAKIEYVHKDLEPILKETQGVLIYQEQIMAISRVLGGFTPAEADDLRKAMGKKNIETMDKLKNKFIGGGISKGYDEKFLTDLYSMMSGFAEYGFNKSHSVCYALIAYQEAYIKAHYATEYYVALLNTVINDPDKIELYLNEIRQKMVDIVLPSILESNALFTQKDGKIIYALHAIKGIGYQAALAIEEERKNGGQFVSIEDFVNRVPIQLVNKKAYETLIKANAFKAFGHNVNSLLSSLESIMAYASNYQKESSSGQNMLFDSSSESSAGAILMIQKEVENSVDILREYEKETLGFCLQYHPFANYISLIDYKYFNNVLDFESLKDKDTFVLPCVVTTVRETQTKRGIPMIIADTLDLYGEKTFFIKKKEDIEKFSSYLIANSAILIKGRRDTSKYDGKNYDTVIDIKPLDIALNDSKGKLIAIKRNMEIEQNSKIKSYRENNNITNQNLKQNTKNENAVKTEHTNCQNSFVKKSGKYSKVEIEINKNLFDCMELYCLQNTIKKYPGECPVYVRIINDKDIRFFEVGDTFKVNPNNLFIEDSHKNIRSLININLI